MYVNVESCEICWFWISLMRLTHCSFFWFNCSSCLTYWHGNSTICSLGQPWISSIFFGCCFMMHVRFEKYGSWKWTINDIFYKKLVASVLGATPHFPHFQVANLVFQCVFFLNIPSLQLGFQCLQRSLFALFFSHNKCGSPNSAIPLQGERHSEWYTNCLGSLVWAWARHGWSKKAQKPKSHWQHTLRIERGR